MVSVSRVSLKFEPSNFLETKMSINRSVCFSDSWKVFIFLIIFECLHSA